MSLFSTDYYPIFITKKSIPGIFGPFRSYFLAYKEAYDLKMGNALFLKYRNSFYVTDLWIFTNKYKNPGFNIFSSELACVYFMIKKQ